MNITELVGRFPVPANPLAPKPKRRPIKISALVEAKEQKAAELELLSTPNSVGSPEYFRAEGEFNALRREWEVKLARRREIERLRQGEIQYGKLSAEKVAALRALEIQLKALEDRGERQTSAAYALTNKAQALAYEIKCCAELISGANKYDEFGQRVLGFREERERLEAEKREAGDED